jgi:hypothetical protein
MKFKSLVVATSGITLFCLTYLPFVAAEAQESQAQMTFASPAEATNALAAAAKAHDRGRMRQIFGSEATNMMTGDAALDEKHFEDFSRRIAERCEIIQQPNNGATLEIGTDRWPFPIPLVQTNGVWLFDTVAGEEEVINRHIGHDEYHAIGVCRAYAKAQTDYAAEFSGGGTPHYAMRLKSEPGKTDGLYWADTVDGKTSPFTSVVAEASGEGHHWGSGNGAHPFHGYFFKILSRQGSAATGGKMDYVQDGQMTGGFALVAYPINWGESGIMTFVVGKDGIVYQRNLGEKTGRIAARMKDYNPDTEWTVVSDPGITDLKEDEESTTQ